MVNTKLTKKEKKVLDTVYEVGFGSIELEVDNGLISSETLNVHRRCKLSCPLWQPDKQLVPGSGLSAEQKRLVEKIRSCHRPSKVVITATSGKPSDIDIHENVPLSH